jgi:signal transduction histidine kinase/DNA-binding response OmpR family regulator
MTLATPQAAPLILVADDDPLLAEVVGPILSQEGYRTSIARNGGECLHKVQEELPQLILLDAVMPDPDGFACCRQIRTLEAGATIPILMITHLEDNESVNRAFEAGATDYIQKPLHWGVLKQRIRRLLQAHRDWQEKTQLIQELDFQVKVRNAELRTAVELEQLLRVITDKVRSTLKEKEVLATAVQELTHRLDLGYCKVAMPNSDGQTYQIAYEHQGYLNFLLPHDHPLLNLEIWPQLQRGETILYSCLVSDGQKITELCCPLLDNEEFLGFLSLIRSPEHSFNHLEVRLAEQVANQCVIGIRQSRLHQATLQQVSQLADLNQLKDEFVHLVSHELRTPLTNMKMALKMLEAANYSERQQRYFRILQCEWQRELDLVNDLLDLQSLESGTRRLHLETISLHEWIQPFLEPFFIRFQDRQQTLRLSLPVQECILTTDVKLLNRVLAELLNNACKYTPTGETVILSVAPDNQQIQIQVTNLGVEIPAEQLPRIFDKFYRIAHLDRDHQGGTGLGLALVKTVVEHLQGQLQVESRQQITTFSLVLPSLLPPQAHLGPATTTCA